MAINFVNHQQASPSRQHRKQKRGINLRGKKSHIRYMLISCGITLLVLAYPSWTLAKKYQLLRALDDNVDQIEKLNSENEDGLLNNLEDDLSDTKDQAQSLQKIDGVSGNEELENLVNKYNKLVDEYTELLTKHESDGRAQEIFQEQNTLYENLEINSIITTEINVRDAAEINVQLAEKKQWLKKVSDTQKELDDLDEEIRDLTGLSGEEETKKILTNHHQLVSANIKSAKADCQSIIEILENISAIYMNTDDMSSLSDEEDINNISGVIKAKGQLFKEKSMTIGSDVKVSDHFSAWQTSISEFMFEAGKSYIEIATKIENEETVSLEDISVLLNMEENVDLASKSIIDYYANMVYSYQIQHQDWENGIITGDLKNELDIKRQQLDEIKTKLDNHRVELQNSGLLKLIKG